MHICVSLLVLFVLICKCCAVCIVMKGHIEGMTSCKILLAPFKLFLLSRVIYYGS